MPALVNVAREKSHALQSAGRKRVLQQTERIDNMHVMRDGKKLVSFSCNDYLGLSHHPDVIEAACDAAKRYGAGAAASRLVTGNHPLYAALEEEVAQWKGAEAACVTGSGYLANIGIIPALMNKYDLIVADKLVHACLLDGAQLSGAKLMRFKHNDVADCERFLLENRHAHRNCMIITDEVFSMDGDVAPLEALASLGRKYDSWLMADAAHSIMPSKVAVDIRMGTFSKAFGSYGGYVCGARDVIDYLITSMRSLLFSTALPASAIAASRASLRIIQQNPALLELPLKHAQLFALTAGLAKPESHIVPLIVGGETRALELAHRLEEERFLVVAIRPPTVPENTSRLRFTFSATHQESDILRLAHLVKRWV